MLMQNCTKYPRRINGCNDKQDCITAKDPCPPHHFLYLREIKSWWCGEEGEEEKGEKGEKVSLQGAWLKSRA